MARQSNNFVMHNATGMFGGQVVFKKRDGTRYVAAPTNVNENRKSTPNQLRGRNGSSEAWSIQRKPMQSRIKSGL
jgi:hypothetical protein